MELLKQLCDINSSSGEESYIRDFIIKQISGHCDFYTDKIGNLICFKKGRKSVPEKIVYSAHMDEVGFMVERIEDDGTLVMGSIGVSPSVVGGKSIRIRSTVNPDKPKWINGVFGLGPIPKMEVAGAAVATVIGQFVAGIMATVLLLKKVPDVKPDIRKMRWDAPIVKDIYRIGIPSIVMQCISSVMNFGMNLILISFTEAATAFFGAYYKLQSFFFMPVFGASVVTG